MDHLLGQLNLSSKPKSAASEEEGRAPIELLSQFLLAVQDRQMKDALAMARELLVYEPDNKMIKEYHKYIQEYIAQGLDEEEKDAEESSEEEEEDDAEDSDAEGSESSSEDEAKKPTFAESKKKEESKKGDVSVSVSRKTEESKRGEVAKRPTKR